MTTCRFPDEERPFFTRHAWLGWLLMLLGLVLFVLASYSLVNRTLIFRYDDRVMDRLEPVADGMAGGLESAMTFIANAGSIGPTLVVLYLSYRYLRRKCDDRFNLLLMSYGVGLLLFWIFSLIFNRERPDLPGLLSRFPFPSFPSGHLIQTITLLAPLLYLYLPRIQSRTTRLMLVLLALAYTLFIAYNRVILNAHYFSDVVAGAALGLFWTVAVIKGFEWYHLRIANRRVPQEA